MTLSRRAALTVLGGGVVLAATGCAAGFALTRTPRKAIEPWDLAGQYDDPRLNALSYALLAPNPHNLQPWLIELVSDDGIRLHHDKTKRLPETDPFDRQIVIGFGCFLEQMVIAASTTGHAIEISLFPDGEDGPIAQATFSTGIDADPLAASILQRRSCKEPFENREIESDKVRMLEPFASIITDGAQVDEIKALTWDSWKVEAETPRTYNESVELMRFGRSEINANPDGIHLGGVFFESLILLGQLNREQQLDTNSMSYKKGFEIYQKMLEATPAYAVLFSDTNTRADQIEAGRQWLRLNLRTTELGLALHPISQCLQEYAEMEVNYTKAHSLLATGGQTVQMLGRLGYGPTIAPTPRWPLEEKRLNA